MCGISGFVGLSLDKQNKLMLVLGLAEGIDNRGGHSCGYASIAEDGDLRYARKSGNWIRSRMRFIEGAAGEICMMHSRFATCGSKEDPMNAHPFAIHRGGRVVMWGAHNGMVPTAFESAKSYKRDISVDSQEIFELLADKNYDGIRALKGYGVITWIDTDHRDHISLARLSSHSDICVVSIKGGGVVWGSTYKIVKDALRFADLEIDVEFIIDDIGRVYRINANGVFKTKLNGIKVEPYVSKSSSHKIANWTSSIQSEVKPASAKPDEETEKKIEVIDETALVESREPAKYTNYSCGSTDPNWISGWSD